MGTIARTRSLDCRRNSHAPTRLNEGANVLDPCALVDVNREEPAGLIRKERVNAHHVSAREVANHRGVVERDERLIWAVAALDLGQFAHALDELVSARRGVSALPSPPTLESSREDVLTSAKQRAKQPHFLRRCPGNRRLKGKWQRYVDFRFGVERSQFCSKGGEAMPRLGLLGFKRGEQSLLVRNGVVQCIAAHPLSGRLGSVFSSLLSVVLHELTAGSAPDTGHAPQEI